MFVCERWSHHVAADSPFTDPFFYLSRIRPKPIRASLNLELVISSASKLPQLEQKLLPEPCPGGLEVTQPPPGACLQNPQKSDI